MRLFVSYRYSDSDVCPLKDERLAIVRDYVDFLASKVYQGKLIYGGELDDEKLSYMDEDEKMRELNHMIDGTSVTIVLISPNMKDPNRWEVNQWIPWEISYSLHRETTYGVHTPSNALLGVILPDRHGSYDYFDFMNQFRIIQSNIKGEYMVTVCWHEFINDINGYIEVAIKAKKHHRPYWKI